MGDGALKIMNVFRSKGIVVSGIFASDDFVRGHSFEGFRVHKLSEIEESVDDFVVVSETEIAEAICFLGERMKLIVEGAGASTVAAVLFKKFKYEPGSKIVCVTSGGNIELSRFAECYTISKDLMKTVGK